MLSSLCHLVGATFPENTPVTFGLCDHGILFNHCTQVMAPRIWMDGIPYEVTESKEEKKSEDEDLEVKPGRITLPFSPDGDRAEQLIIVEDTENPQSAVLRSFKRQGQTYDLRGGFYIDRESLLSKQRAKCLIRSNLYLCQEMTSLNLCSDSYVTLQFQTLDGGEKKQVFRVNLKDNQDAEIEFTVCFEWSG